MTDTNWNLIVADTFLIIHVGFILFVVLGLVLILVGKLLRWQWVHAFWFRLVHLAAILFVVIQTWLGQICPLTRWEMAFRAKGGAETYSGDFISYWLHKLIYFQAPMWVFALIYTLFAALVVFSWFWVKPKKRNNNPS